MKQKSIQTPLGHQKYKHKDLASQLNWKFQGF